MPLPPGPLELFSGAAASPIARHLQRRARRVRVVGWGRSWPRIFASHLVEETQHGRSQHMYNEFAGDWPTAQSIVSKILNKPNDQSYSDPVLCKGWQCSWDRSSQKEVYDCTIFPSWVILRTLVTANFKCRWLEGIEKAF
uniref:Uncharacterized protein n=1 Tax=Oryza glumipatula TaxID=40148 RepID=A0A0E0ACR7_9ORYZ